MKKKIFGICVCMLVVAVPGASVIGTTTQDNCSVLEMIKGYWNVDYNIIKKNSAMGNWSEIAKLVASDGAEGDTFGSAVSLSGDYVVIGAPAYYTKGYAYVFKYSGLSWIEEAKLFDPNGGPSEGFGTSVSLNGNYVVIGAFADILARGSACVFNHSGSSWVEEAKLLSSDGAPDDWFGRSVSLSGDYVVIGAPNNNGSGSAYVFKHSGSSWIEEAKLVASDGAPGDWFGREVSLCGDYVVITAPLDDGSGSAYVFKHSGSSWIEEAKLVASDGAPGDFFGISVSLNGNYVVIGAPLDEYRGSAYVFNHSGSSWIEEAKLVASDAEENDQFGFSVSLSGNYVVVANPGDDFGLGAAYVFNHSGLSWIEEAKLIPLDQGDPDKQFGFSVSLRGHNVVLGAPFDFDDGRGSAYVFTNNQPPVADFTWTPQNPIQNQPVLFDASASQDPDGTITLYEWDWDNDGTYEENHASSTATHSWASAGTYPVTVRVTDDDKDLHLTGNITKTVTVVSAVVNFNINITGGFGVNAIITNNGNINATKVKWTFTLTGGFVLLGKTKSGTLIPMEPGATKTIKDTPILGFGKTTITIEVTCAEGVSATQTKTGFVILFFVIGVK